MRITSACPFITDRSIWCEYAIHGEKADVEEQKDLICEEAMTEKQTQLYMTNRDEWRAWLEDHHETTQEIWLVYYKKHTGKPTIPYDDAVEEALCYGWIDSLVKRIDDERYTQKYTPRKKNSVWSKKNKERVAKMIKQGRMTAAGLAKIEEAKNNDQWDKTAGSLPETLTIPQDLKDALTENPTALHNFHQFTPSYQKRYIAWIDSAKRESTRQKRIKETVKRSEQNKKPGMQ